MNENEYKLLEEAVKSVKKYIPYEPELAITLGSGLGDFVEKLNIDATIDFNMVKNLPHATNANHKGRFVFTKINGVKVLIMQGRLHYYEGYLANEAVRPVRIVNMLGVNTIIFTNAAGGINKKFKQGDIMLITDHISHYVPNPLYGQNIEEFGTRFPDMTNVYDLKLQKLIKKAASEAKIKLKEGVYVQLRGPSFETPAEIKLLAGEGIDAVGMSTVIEAIAAKHAGMRIGGLSVITNMAAGLSKELQSDEDVRINAAKATEKLERILKNTINKELFEVL